MKHRLHPGQSMSLKKRKSNFFFFTDTAFIGAGSINARKEDVNGLTTAAALWMVGSIGLMVGLGNYFLPIASTSIIFIILRIGVIVDKRYKEKYKGKKLDL